MTCFEKRLITLPNSLKLARQLLKLLIVAKILAFTVLNAVVELCGAGSFSLLLTDQLALSVEQEAVAAVSILTVFLKSLRLSLTAAKLCTGDLELGGSII